MCVRVCLRVCVCLSVCLCVGGTATVERAMSSPEAKVCGGGGGGAGQGGGLV